MSSQGQGRIYPGIFFDNSAVLLRRFQVFPYACVGTDSLAVDFNHPCAGYAAPVAAIVELGGWRGD